MFLIGDGKLMLVSKPKGKCRVCGNVGNMVPTSFVLPIGLFSYFRARKASHW